MKEFFETCLKNLFAVTGIQQFVYMELKAAKSKEAEMEMKRELALLINSMILVSDKFNYIPLESQKKYIIKMMVEDQNYEGLNSRVIWKWLDLHRTAHSFTNEEPIQINGKYFDETSPETQALVNDFLTKLNGKFEVPKMTHEQIKEEGQDKPKRKSAAYIPSPELAIMADLRATYGRECTDLYTGRILEGMPSFDEWVTLQK